jgi:hypothetical protein
MKPADRSLLGGLLMLAALAVLVVTSPWWTRPLP